jgi:hypothetical protein
MLGTALNLGRKQEVLNGIGANRDYATMTDSIIPNWIKAIREKDDQKAERDRVAAMTELLRAKTIQTDAPAYWTQLLNELQITVDSLSHIGLTASLSTTRTSIEEVVEISIRRPGAVRHSVVIDLFYRAGSSTIRSRKGNTYSDMHFSVVDREIRLLCDNGPQKPAQAAQSIIEPLVKYLRNQPTNF